MPTLNASGQIFDLDAAAGFNEGYLGASASIGLGSDFNANIDACHGFQGKLDVAVKAQAEIALKLLWLLKGTASGEAAATAGVELTTKLDLDIFNIMGFDAKATASAEAYAAGKLSVGLTFEDLANIARDLIEEDFIYDILIAFLNEVTIRAGVWGMVSAGASASAEISIKGSLQDDKNSGFDVKMGYHAALGVGAGYGMFAGMKFENPKRFYLYATERISFEIRDRLKSVLPPETHQYIELVPLVLPSILNASYELAQEITSDIDVSAPEKVFDSITNNFLSQLQRFFLDKITEAVLGYTSQLLNGAVVRILMDDDLSGDFRQYEVLLDRILPKLQKREFDIDSFTQLMDDIIALMNELSVAEDEYTGVLSAGWLSFNTAESLRRGIVSAQASASASLIGMGKRYSGQTNIRIDNVPEFVSNILRVHFGPTVDVEGSIDVSNVLDYLLSTKIAKNITDHIPQLQFLMNMLQLHLNMTPGEVVEAALDISWDSGVTRNELYLNVKNLLSNLIENYIKEEVFTPSLNNPSVDENIKKYIAEVIIPSTGIFTDFALSRVDAFINSGASNRSEDLFDDSFKSALSLCVLKVISTNVVVVSDILISHGIQHIHTAFRSLAQILERDSDHILARSAGTVFQSLLPTGIAAVPRAQEIEAVRELACNLCYAASEISGPLIFNEETKSELRRLYKSLFLALDNDLQNNDYDRYTEFFDHVTECTYIPNPITVKELTGFQIQLAAKGLTQITPLVVDALGLFCLRLTTGKVNELSELIEDIFNTIAELIASINRAIAAIQSQLQRIRETYEDALKSFEDALEDLQNQLANTAAMKDAFLSDLKRVGLSRIDPADGAAIALFEVSFTAASVLIGSCFDLIGLSLKPGITLVDTLEDVPQIIENVITEFNKGVTDLINNSPIPLPAEITLKDIENACVALLENLTDDISDLAAKKEAEIKAHRAMIVKEEQKIMHEELVAEIEASNSLPLQVTPQLEFQSPLAFLDPATGKNLDWTYGKEIPVEILMRDASTKLLCTEPKGIFLAVNGLPLEYELEDWHVSQNKKNLTYSTTLRYGSHNLRSGINVIECTIVQNGNTIQKNKVEFIMNPDLASRSKITLDLKNSNINTAGDDHKHTASEFICLKNEGNMPAELTNWLITDRKRHQFILPEVRLLPQESLRIYTGSGRNTSFDVYQNRKRAIWNNTGDLVMVVNEHRVLVIYKKY